MGAFFICKYINYIAILVFSSMGCLYCRYFKILQFVKARQYYFELTKGHSPGVKAMRYIKIVTIILLLAIVQASAENRKALSIPPWTKFIELDTAGMEIKTDNLLFSGMTRLCEMNKGDLHLTVMIEFDRSNSGDSLNDRTFNEPAWEISDNIAEAEEGEQLKLEARSKFNDVNVKLKFSYGQASGIQKSDLENFIENILIKRKADTSMQEIDSLYHHYNLTEDTRVVDKLYKCDKSLYSMLLWAATLRSRDDQIAMTSRFIDENPRTGVEYGYFQRGFLNTLAEKHDEGIADLTRALADIQDNFIGHYFRAYCYMGKGEIEKALQDLVIAISMNDKFAPAFELRGSVWMKKGEGDKAIVDYSMAIKLQPRPDLYFIRGNLFYEKGDYQAALADMEEAVKLNPSLEKDLRDKIQIIKKELGK